MDKFLEGFMMPILSVLSISPDWLFTVIGFVLGLAAMIAVGTVVLTVVAVLILAAFSD